MDEVKNSYFEKKSTTCPCCGIDFFRENYFSGSNRFIAKDLSLDLRRQYQPTERYGYIYPLIYCVVVCPECFYADFPETFNFVNEEEKKDLLKHQFVALEKIKEMLLIESESVDFSQHRGLKEGIISYFLTISYINNKFHENSNDGLFKKGLSAIRCAWCLEDLMIIDPTNKEYWNSLRNYFYFLAYKVYDSLIEIISKSSSVFQKMQWLGPDLDFNFGMDGVFYLAGYLGYAHYEHIEDKEVFKKKMIDYSKCFSRIFGKGKASTDKTRPLLLHAEEMYKKVSVITRLFD